jgi:protein tyrosine/serine phosphatase
MRDLVLGPQDRILVWDGCLNVRDLGGHPATGGCRTRWRALVRADDLCRLTPAGREAVVAYRLRTVVDIRFPSEVARAAHPFAGPAAEPSSPTYLNIPVNAGRDPAADAALAAAFGAATTRAEANRLELDANRVGSARIVAAVAQARPGGVVVHCHAGHGRTGLAVALMLAVVGVPGQAIADDYALSTDSLDESYARWLAERADANAVEAEALRRQSSAEPEAMLQTLAYLVRRYGGAHDYLLGGGATHADLEALKTRLLESLSPP